MCVLRTAFLQKVISHASSRCSFITPSVLFTVFHHPARPPQNFGSAMCLKRFPSRFARRLAIKISVEGRSFEYRRSNIALLDGLGSQCGSQFGCLISANSAIRRMMFFTSLLFALRRRRCWRLCLAFVWSFLSTQPD